jgi:hypothetical protein
MLNRLAAIVALALPLTASAAFAQEGPESPNVGHTRHHHAHNPKHPSAPDAGRFTTSRSAAAILPLPEEKDAFTFVVFGDRTGGPDEGVAVLADSVRDTNLFEPDLVMTVGDLIEGYNTPDRWMVQMKEYRAVMDKLICPWFPVAGNHDVYWRGLGQKPSGEHEAAYEVHFGPLWYAFEHKNSWFIALYSDEGNPETGEKNFNKPECQKMSDEQFAWLKETLAKAKNADHVFLFLHHPRWLKGNYGDDWDKVHAALKEAGNVTAVFGGHIHRMRYDGERDGIEYITLATVGGHQEGVVPGFGWLHQFHIITVRKGQVAMAAVPVGEAMDVREMTGEIADEAVKFSRTKTVFSGPIAIAADGAIDATVTVTLSNPTSRNMDVTMLPESGDSRWVFGPDHDHATVKAGESGEFKFRVRRPAGSLDPYLRPPTLVIESDLLLPGNRYAMPTRHDEFPLDLTNARPAEPANELAINLTGGAVAMVDSSDLKLPDGPFTIECWMKARSFGERTGLLCKTEQSDYGIYVNGGKPSFSAFIGGAYAETQGGSLTVGSWHHVAGVFDGREVRLYVDGNIVGAAPKTGKRKMNALPLMIGADVDGEGRAVSKFDGWIDTVRVSTVARYSGERFKPARRLATDTDTALLLNMDGVVGPWLYDESKSAAHATVVGEAAVEAVK